MSNTNTIPNVSVVVAALNEQDNIVQCIDSLRKQTCYKRNECEIIVVDGGSTDDTLMLVRSLCEEDSRIKLKSNPDQSAPYAFNIGINESLSEFVCIFGAHANYDENYIDECMLVLKENAEIVGCSGAVNLIRDDTNYFSEIAFVVFSSKFGVSSSSFRTKSSGYSKSIPYGVFRRQRLVNIGGYNTSLTRNQDNDVNERLIRNGGKLYITDTTTASYHAVSTFRAFLRYAYRNGFWNLKGLSHNSKSMQLHHFIPMFFVIFLIAFLTACISWLIFIGKGLVASVLAFSAVSAILMHLVLGAWFSFVAVKNRDIGLWVLLLPASFLIFHLAYGIGSVFGLIVLSGTVMRKIFHRLFKKHKQ